MQRFFPNKKLIFYGVLLFTILFLCNNILKAQYVDFGQDPASIKWNQIKSNYFTIIYPRGFDNEAKRLATMLYKIRHAQDSLMKVKPFRINVVLHNYSTITNGAVILAPRRMELYTCPGDDLYPQEWLEQLIIHEARHVEQCDRLKVGWTRFLSILFGSQAEGAVMGLFFPLWYLEGDAVAAETGMGNAGRGRLPDFRKDIRAQLVEKKIYSFEKATMGSYRDYVADHYRLGYEIVANTMKTNSIHTWNKVHYWTAKKPVNIAPFNIGLKKNVGMRKRKLYLKQMTALQQEYKKIDTNKTITSYEPIGKQRENQFFNYENPYFINDSVVLCEQYSMNQIGRFISIDKNQFEKVIFTPGFSFANSMHYAHSKIAWTELQSDVRWSNRSYQILKLYDFSTNEVKTLHKKSRFFSPALSIDGSKIVCSEISPMNEYKLVILDANSGMILKEYQHPNNLLFMKPRFYSSGDTIVAITLGNKGKSLVLLDLNNDNIDYLLHDITWDISNPQFWNNYIVFNATFKDVNEIYALNLSDKKIYQLTASRFGAKNASFSPDNQEMIYAYYTSDGYRIAKAKVKALLWKPIEQNNWYVDSLAQFLTENMYNPLTHSIDTTNLFKTRRYSKLAHLVHIHSWAPIYIDPDEGVVDNGISLSSQNMLSTTIITAGYFNNSSKKTDGFKTSLTYSGFFPDISISYQNQNLQYTYITSTGDTTKPKYKEEDGGIYITFPLNFTKGCFQHGFAASISNNIAKFNFKGPDPGWYTNNNHFYVGYQLQYYTLQKMAYRDINPRLGIVVRAFMKQTPIKNTIYVGDLTSITLKAYLPGIIHNHSLNFYLAEQIRERARMQFSNNIMLPRGWNDTLVKNITSTQVNYLFPIVYPDIHLGSLFYLKRIHTNLFFDYAYIDHQRSNFKNGYIFSYGCELLGSFHFLRFLAPLSLGTRIVKTNANNAKIMFEPVFSIDFNALEARKRFMN